MARRLAEALQSKHIEVWWAPWRIAAGDSLRQKIDEGLAGCTHFLVLLTPQSVNRPWVNQEMDAALVRKLRDQCRFLPVRFELPASKLPPLLEGIYSPEICSAEDVQQLISDIHGITRKPPLGEPPAVVAAQLKQMSGYSSAANAIAQYFVEHSEHGDFADPQVSLAELSEAIGLTMDDARDGLHELRDFMEVSAWDDVRVHANLFPRFDGYWKSWNPAQDALRLAADLVNDDTLPSQAMGIAERYGWDARRLNPALTYLLEHSLIRECRLTGAFPYTMFRVQGTDDLRRFVKNRG